MARRERAAPALVILLALGACGPSEPNPERAAEAVQEGLAAHRAGQTEDAEEAYEEALEHDPDNKYALFNLGLIAQTRGDDSLAEMRYRRALRTDPDPLNVPGQHASAVAERERAQRLAQPFAR